MTGEGRLPLELCERTRRTYPPMHLGLSASEKGSKTDLLKNADCQHFVGKVGLFEGPGNRAIENHHLAIKNDFSMFSTWVHGCWVDLGWHHGTNRRVPCKSFICVGTKLWNFEPKDDEVVIKRGKRDR